MHPPSQAKFLLGKTYSKPKKKGKPKRRRAESDRPSIVPCQNALSPHHNQSIFNSDHSLRDDYWMDDFDLIAQGKTPLRNKNLIRKDVCADYNRDSSIEGSPMPLSPLIASRVHSALPDPDSPFKIQASPLASCSKSVTPSPANKIVRSSGDQFSIFARKALLESRAKRDRSIPENGSSFLDTTFNNGVSANVLSDTISRVNVSCLNSKTSQEKPTISNENLQRSVIKLIFFASDSSSEDEDENIEYTNTNSIHESPMNGVDPPSNERSPENHSLQKSPSATQNFVRINNESVILEGNSLSTSESGNTTQPFLMFHQENAGSSLLSTGNNLYLSEGNSPSTSESGNTTQPFLMFHQEDVDSNLLSAGTERVLDIEKELDRETFREDNVESSQAPLCVMQGESADLSINNATSLANEIDSNKPVLRRKPGRPASKKALNFEKSNKGKATEGNVPTALNEASAMRGQQEITPSPTNELPSVSDSTHSFVEVCDGGTSIQAQKTASRPQGSKTQIARPVGGIRRTTRLAAKQNLQLDTNLSTINENSENICEETIDKKSQPLTRSKNVDVSKNSSREISLAKENEIKTTQTKNNNNKESAAKIKTKSQNRRGEQIKLDKNIYQNNKNKRYFLRSKRNTLNQTLSKKSFAQFEKAKKGTDLGKRASPDYTMEHETDQPNLENNSAAQNQGIERLSFSSMHDTHNNRVSANESVSSLKNSRGSAKVISRLSSTPVWKKLRHVKVKLKRIHTPQRKRGKASQLNTLEAQETPEAQETSLGENSPILEKHLKTPKQSLGKISSLPSTSVWKHLRRVKVKLKRIHPTHKKRQKHSIGSKVSENQEIEEASMQDQQISSNSISFDAFHQSNDQVIPNVPINLPEKVLLTYSEQETNSVLDQPESENQAGNDSDSSVDSLLDFNTYKKLVNISSLENSTFEKRNSMDSHANFICANESARKERREANDVIRKRKSRLQAVESFESSNTKLQKLQDTVHSTKIKNVRIRLKRLKILSKSDNLIDSVNTSNSVNTKFVNTSRCDESLELSNKVLSSVNDMSNTTQNTLDQINLPLDSTKRQTNSSTKSVHMNIETTSIPSPYSNRNSSKTNLSNQISITPLQRTLDDSIDRIDFINAINRNATQFMNKSNAPLTSISENFVDSNPMIGKSYRNESPMPSPSGLIPVMRRSSILTGSGVNSLITTLCEIAENEIDCEKSLSAASLTLPSGKWRKALSSWKAKNSIIADKTIGPSSGNTSANISNNHSTSISRRQQLKNYQNSPTTNTSYMLLSSRGKSVVRKDNVHVSNVESESLKGINRSLRHTNVKTKPSAFVVTRPEPILEHQSPNQLNSQPKPTSLEDNVNVLLLEPTDDEAPNLPSISLLESAVEQNLHIFPRPSQKDFESGKAAATKTTVADIDQSYSPRRLFNETDSNEFHRQIYQHQLSVPLYRQPSIPRRRRTSVVERCDDHSIIPIRTTGGRQRHLNGAGDGSDENLHHFTDFVHIPYERGILSTSLSPRDRVLRRCNQFEPLEFSIVYSENVLRHCRKIGEGVYGEVFMNKTVRGEAVVLKIIPIEGTIEVNGEPQKTFEQILSEIVIAMELSRLRDDEQFMTGGFVDVKKVCCVQGRYPDHLIDLWELYRDNCGTENDHPEIFPEDQTYIVLELANGGQDLEAFTFQNALQSYSAFAQVALTLAVAEEKFQFEHRDLHWGNILLAPTDDTTIVFRLNGEEIKIPSHGVKATIIDYTLSRMVFNGCCLYNDLSNDSELFLATGDYQFDIYRFMKQHLKNQWTSFEPYTNILWLHYTIDKMISGARYRCSKSKKHRTAIQDMMRLRDELLDYKSASDYVECLK